MGIHLAGFPGIGIQPYPLFRLCYSCHICVYPLSPAVEHLALCVAVVGICSRARSRFLFRDAGSGGCVHDFDGLVRSATFAVVYAQRLSGRHGAGLPDVGRMELHLVCDVACAVAAGVRDDA